MTAALDAQAQPLATDLLVPRVDGEVERKRCGQALLDEQGAEREDRRLDQHAPVYPANTMTVTGPDWSPAFPRLADLFRASDMTAPRNWFLEAGVVQARGRKASGWHQIESDLEMLDAESWLVLRGKAAPYVHLLDQWGYHAQLFDHLNEVKGYLALTELGARDVRLVPEGGTPTPDLRASLDSRPVVMEVKTIRESRWQKEYFEIPAVQRDAVRGESEPPDGLNGKIRDALARATAQLASEPLARRMIYLVIRLDFNLHGQAAVSDFVQAERSPDVEVRLHWLG